MERQTGSTRLTGSPGGQGGVGGGDDDLLRAVKEAAAAEYDILGEMGRGERGSVVYLSRERASQKLVALKLRPDGGEYELSVLRELDASVPAMGNKCPSCKVDLVGWGRFCSHCGKDLSGTRWAKPRARSCSRPCRAPPKASTKCSARCNVPRAEEPSTSRVSSDGGRLVALRLTREQESDGSESYALGVTQVIEPLVASLGATYASPTSVMQRRARRRRARRRRPHARLSPQRGARRRRA